MAQSQSSLATKLYLIVSIDWVIMTQQLIFGRGPLCLAVSNPDDYRGVLYDRAEFILCQCLLCWFLASLSALGRLSWDIVLGSILDCGFPYHSPLTYLHCNRY